MSVLFLILATLLPFFLFTSCTNEDEKEVIELKSIGLNVKTLKLEVGDTYQFEAITSPSNYPQDDFVWTVVTEDNKTGGGRIDSTGLFVATKSGTVIVEVVNHGIKDNSSRLIWANAMVTIIGEDGDKEDDDKPDEEGQTLVSNISFEEQNISLKKGETTYIDYTIQPSYADVSGVKWYVSDNSVVSITSISNGRIGINALKEGKAEVYTTVNGKRYACQITVETIAVESIILNPSNITINQGESFTLDVSVYPYNADNSELKFEFSDKSIAYFANEEQRIINTSNPGECTVTVSTKDGTVKAECIITVLEIPLEEKITASTRLNGLYNNGFITGTMYIKFHNGSNKNVTINRFYVYDSFSNQIVYEEKDCGKLMGGDDWSSALMFKMVYKPLYVWEYECEGESYRLNYQ